MAKGENCGVLKFKAEFLSQLQVRDPPPDFIPNYSRCRHLLTNYDELLHPSGMLNPDGNSIVEYGLYNLCEKYEENGGVCTFDEWYGGVEGCPTIIGLYLDLKSLATEKGMAAYEEWLDRQASNETDNKKSP